MHQDIGRRSRRGRTRPRHLSASAPRPRVLIVSGSVGAGHDGAAAALASRLRAGGTDVDIRDYLFAFPAPIRAAMRGSYAVSVNYLPSVFEWLFTTIEHRTVVHRLSLAFCRLAQRRVQQWVRPGYDAVVSTYPFASQTLGQLRAQGQLRCAVVTFLTDPAAHRLWVHPGVDHHLTVTQATAEQGERRYGVPMQVGGPLVAERFSRQPESPAALRARATIRAELCLGADTPVALILAGSLGLGDVALTVDAVLAGRWAIPVVVCGHNERLRGQLSQRPGARALGWRADMPDLMAAADVLITNAGGLSFTEALVAGLPAVCFAPIPGHGRANAALLDTAGLAPWAHTPTELTVAMQVATERQVNRGTPPPSLVAAFVAGLPSGHLHPDRPPRARWFSRPRRRVAA